MYYGAGAGMLPTAMSVVSDMIEISRNLAAKSSSRPRPTTPRKLVPIDDVRTRYYLRFGVHDQPGVLGQLMTILGAHHVSIAQVVQDGGAKRRPPYDGGRLAAAVYIDPRRDGDRGYFGMLSVDPEFQGMGLGTRLVRIAEAMCEAMGARSVRLNIVNLREELGRWYRSLGYHEVGTAPYDHRPVKQPCHFVEMHKHFAA
jgi:GNAT superfamily N-acetyltransferase